MKPCGRNIPSMIFVPRYKEIHLEFNGRSMQLALERQIHLNHDCLLPLYHEALIQKTYALWYKLDLNFPRFSGSMVAK